MQYLYISADIDGQCVFPCDARELKMTMNYNKPKILERWPSDSHGPSFPMNRYKGTIILDLQGEDPTKPLTKEEIKELIK
jgi:hypothetical protein